MKKLVLPLLLLVAACEEPAGSVASASASAPAPKTSGSTKPAAASSASGSGSGAAAPSASASAEEQKKLTKLPGKLDKGLAGSTPEDIKKACEANGLKCELKK